MDSQPSTAEEPSLTCSALNCATLFLYRSLSLSAVHSVVCSPEPAQALLALNRSVLLGGNLPCTLCSGVWSAGVWGINRATSMDYSTSLAAEPPATGRALYCSTLLTDWYLAFRDTLISSSISRCGSSSHTPGSALGSVAEWAPLVGCTDHEAPGDRWHVNWSCGRLLHTNLPLISLQP